MDNFSLSLHINVRDGRGIWRRRKVDAQVEGFLKKKY